MKDHGEGRWFKLLVLRIAQSRLYRGTLSSRYASAVYVPITYITDSSIRKVTGGKIARSQFFKCLCKRFEPIDWRANERQRERIEKHSSLDGGWGGERQREEGEERRRENWSGWKEA